jgi:hypothetical protein
MFFGIRPIFRFAKRRLSIICWLRNQQSPYSFCQRYVSDLLSQPALGKLMGIDGQSVARWEKTSKVPRWVDKLLRLLYTAQAEGSEPIAKAVERIST